ncbi:MAG: hypothetical protein C4334_10560 [Pyrinomonas sp.]|uniref:ABC transporter ATP-binding protein n=1 Tax=Pyrinomonas sp. TaxID=2080306 RepID=UPI00331A9C88
MENSSAALSSTEAERIANRIEPVEDGGAALVVRDLCKSFRHPMKGSVDVLRRASFFVNEGEIVAIMGASGAGKTTLLHLIAGIEQADAGEIVFHRFDVTRADEATLARWRRESLALVFQAHRLLPDLTTLENVALPLLIARRSRREAQERAGRLLARVGLSDRSAHSVVRLSAGEQQRAAIARALISTPSLLLADEPTGNLDPQTAADVVELLIALCREHRTTALIVTHNEQVAQRCDRALFIEGGMIRRSTRW